MSIKGIKERCWDDYWIKKCKEELDWLNYSDFGFLFNEITKLYPKMPKTWDSVLKVICHPKNKGLIVNFRHELLVSPDMKHFSAGSVNWWIQIMKDMDHKGIINAFYYKKRWIVRLNNSFVRKILGVDNEDK